MEQGVERSPQETLVPQPERKTVGESKNPGGVRRGGNDFMCSKNPVHIAEIKSHQTKPFWNQPLSTFTTKTNSTKYLLCRVFGDTAVGNVIQIMLIPELLVH